MRCECGSQNFKIEKQKPHKILVCERCGKYQKFANDKEIRMYSNSVSLSQTLKLEKEIEILITKFRENMILAVHTCDYDLVDNFLTILNILLDIFT